MMYSYSGSPPPTVSPAIWIPTKYNPVSAAVRGEYESVFICLEGL
jgi:hypothetical protein